LKYITKNSRANNHSELPNNRFTSPSSLVRKLNTEKAYSSNLLIPKRRFASPVTGYSSNNPGGNIPKGPQAPKANIASELRKKYTSNFRGHKAQSSFNPLRSKRVQKTTKPPKTSTSQSRTRVQALNFNPVNSMSSQAQSNQSFKSPLR
jgi:hypothetical protein